MSFNTGLSGLKAASTHLSVTGNNIANAGSTGFKASRAEFADLYAGTIGSGVQTANVSQQFNQGNITKTGNSLDLAINGQGFFKTSNNGAEIYTRNGTFSTDKNGYVVDNSGYRLQGYQADVNGEINKGIPTDLIVATTPQAPKATSKIEQTLTLNSTSAVPNAAVFNPVDASTYNWSTSVSLFDSQGNEHTMMQYFAKNDTNQWTMYATIDGRNPADPASTEPYSAQINFDNFGKLSAINSTQFNVDENNVMTLTDWVPADNKTNPPAWTPNGAVVNAGGVTLNINKVTQTNTTSAVTSITQDGYTTGQLSGLSTDASGKIFARYTNGQSKDVGQVMLVNFANAQGLTPIGGSNWVQSSASGEPVPGEPGTGILGTLEAGSLEDSNVDLTAQLVDLIVAQRNYQANAKTIETESTISQTIIQIR